MTDKILSFTDAIKEGTRMAMERSTNMHVFGLGVNYPNGADGTTGGLAELFPGRVHDIPCSEAAVTGMCVGAAVTGLRPLVHHGRVEFALYAMDQIITQAAKWNYMFGGSYACPITFRIAIGRQWGNGPQHTQFARAMFAVPGLRVVVPSSPRIAKNLIIKSMEDDNPVVFLEHRWLYKTKESVSPEFWASGELGEARCLRQGDDLTIVAVGDMVLEAWKAAKIIQEKCNIKCAVIDPVSVYPIDHLMISKSLEKTRRLLIVDSTPLPYGFGAEMMRIHGPMLSQAAVIGTPDAPCPTATSMSSVYYPIAMAIASFIGQMFNLPVKFEAAEAMTFEGLHHFPTDNFDSLCEGAAVVG